MGTILLYYIIGILITFLFFCIACRFTDRSGWTFEDYKIMFKVSFGSWFIILILLLTILFVIFLYFKDEESLNRMVNDQS